MTRAASPPSRGKLVNSKTTIKSEKKSDEKNEASSNWQLHEEYRQIREKDILQVVINAVPTPIFYKDGQGRYLGCNEAFELYIGKSREELIGCSVYDLFDEEIAAGLAEDDAKVFATGQMQTFEGQARDANGEMRDLIFHKAKFYAERENLEGLVGVLIDITDRKNVEREYQTLALTDPLTGLDNRLSMMRVLKLALEKSLRQHSPLAFMMIDIDNFKYINDSFGHPVGDGFLVEAARRLKKTLRRSDFVARLGGDEFAVIVEGIGGQRQIARVADKILTALAPPCEIEHHTLRINASIGIARAPDDADNSEDLMKYADIALYQAKARGKCRAEFYSG